MKLNDLIEKLTAMQKDYGDAIVNVRNGEGDFNPVSEVDIQRSGPLKGPYKWNVFLEGED